MTTAVEVFPLSLVSIPFQSDPSIRGATDNSTVDSNAEKVQDITKEVKNLKDPENFGVFFMEDKTSLQVDSQTQVYEYNVGRLKFKVQHSTITGFDTISLQTFLAPPNLNVVLVDNSYGSPSTGLSSKLGPKEVIEGTVTIKFNTGAKSTLSYDVTTKVPEVSYAGEITLPF